MRFFLLKSFVLIATCATFCFSNAYASTDYSSYPKISNLETFLFNKDYKNEDIYVRISRLEKNIFGRTSENLSLSERMDNLLSKVTNTPIKDYSTPTEFSKKNIRDIEKIERELFGMNIPEKDYENRLDNLEMTVLGAMQDGSPEERIERIKNAYMGNFNSFSDDDMFSSQDFGNSYQDFGYIPPAFSNNMNSYQNPSVVDMVLPFAAPFINKLKNKTNFRQYNPYQNYYQNGYNNFPVSGFGMSGYNMTRSPLFMGPNRIESYHKDYNQGSRIKILPY